MLSSNADVFEFWKANTFCFPTLAAMAKDYITVQVPSDRAFSSGADLVTSNRCRECDCDGSILEICFIIKKFKSTQSKQE